MTPRRSIATIASGNSSNNSKPSWSSRLSPLVITDLTGSRQRRGSLELSVSWRRGISSRGAGTEHENHIGGSAAGGGYQDDQAGEIEPQDWRAGFLRRGIYKHGLGAGT